MSEHKLLSPGNAAIRRSSTKNIHAIMPGSFEAATRCKHRPHPAYLGNAKLVNPEEAFVAALSSCPHSDVPRSRVQKEVRARRVVDEAVGFMEKNAGGKLAITRVILRQKRNSPEPSSRRRKSSKK